MTRYRWTEESIEKEAKKYKSRKEFEKGSNKAYQAARYRGTLDKVCSHMEAQYISWTPELIKKEVSKYKTLKEFRENSPNAYKSAQTRKIIDKICYNLKRSRAKISPEYAEKVAKQFNLREDLKKHHPSIYKFLMKNKRMDRLIPISLEILQVSEIIERAKKYNYRTDFLNKDPNAYNAARRKKILNIACKHMTKKPNVPLKYTDQDIIAMASQYSTKGEMVKKNPNLYALVRRRKMQNIVFKDMPIVSVSSTPEQNILDMIKTIYPKSQKLIDNKVNIKNHPNINGFHIDIYIPELRKGIEFDGTYHHSLQGLKRGRPNWSDEDIANYHQLKDSYFLTKGIHILHIKEVDWNVDQSNCWQKIFNFLNIKYETYTEEVSVTKVKKINKSINTYDFEIEKNHNYFVNSILTHNSEHLPFLAIDEVDLVQDPRALKEAKMVPTVYKGKFPLTVYLSTRKFAGGLMEKTLKETVDAGGEVLRWNILDVTESISRDVARVNEPKQIRYITKELPMDNISEAEWEKLPRESQAQYERFEAYAGIAEHKMLPVMKNMLVDRPQSDKGFLYKPLIAVHNNFKTTPPDMGEAQLLCNKPSSSGLVYPRFDVIKNVLTVNQALERLSGEKTDINSFEYLRDQILNLGIPIIGGADWGYTDPTALVVIALMPNNEAWLLHTFVEQYLELHDIVLNGRALQNDYNVSKWYAETANPAYLQTLRRSPDDKTAPGAGWKIPSFTKEVLVGISNLQGMIVDSANVRRFYIIDTPDNKQTIEAFGQYKWALDGKGDPIEGRPYHGNDGTSDIMDSIRYVAQNAFGKGKKPISAVTGYDSKNSPLQKQINKSNLQQAGEIVNKAIMKDKIKELTGGAGSGIKKKGKIFWSS